MIDVRVYFTDLKVTQPGYLVKWTFTADLLEGVEYPTLDMYRVVMNVNYQGVIALAISEPFRTIDPPFLVQAGDIVGFDLPENARLSLIIILNYGSVGGVSLRRGQIVDGLPLVSLEIGMYRIYTLASEILYGRITY